MNTIPSLDPSSIKRFDVSRIELDPEEKILCEIRKHPIGVVFTIAIGVFIALIVFITAGSVAAVVSDNASSIGGQSNLISVVALGVGALLGVAVLVFTYIGTYIYQHNVVLVTSDKIAQVLYRTIFDRKISQLNVGDVQDVTVEQRGIFARLFNYGTLTIETAGEQQNYTFTYAPNPYECSKIIITAHEANVKKYGN